MSARNFTTVASKGEKTSAALSPPSSAALSTPSSAALSATVVSGEARRWARYFRHGREDERGTFYQCHGAETRTGARYFRHRREDERGTFAAAVVRRERREKMNAALSSASTRRARQLLHTFARVVIRGREDQRGSRATAIRGNFTAVVSRGEKTSAALSAPSPAEARRRARHVRDTPSSAERREDERGTLVGVDKMSGAL